MEHIVMHTRLNLKLKLDLYSSTLNTKLFNSNVEQIKWHILLNDQLIHPYLSLL